MLVVKIIRHGETRWNREEIFRGRADIELNENGLKQAQLVADYLAAEKITAVYSSPLKRALATAEPIARLHQLQVTVAPELNDLDCGEWQGLSREEVRQRYGSLYNQWLTVPHLVTIPGGENLSDVRKRVLSLIGKIIRINEGTVVLVSHRVVNKILICALLGLENSAFWNIRVDTCSLTTFIYENSRFVLAGHNDTCFLKTLRLAKLADF